MAAGLVTRRFLVGEYQRMIEAGILTEDERIELLDGEIVPMSPMSPRHAATVARLGDLLRELARRHGHLREEKSVVLPPASVPEPDLALVRGRPEDYLHRHPGPEDVQLLAEVSDSSLDRGRGVKLDLYARAGIRAVWLIDLEGDRVIAASEPHPGGYRVVETMGRADGARRLGIPGLPGLTLTVAEVLGLRP